MVVPDEATSHLDSESEAGRLREPGDRLDAVHGFHVRQKATRRTQEPFPDMKALDPAVSGGERGRPTSENEEGSFAPRAGERER